MDEIWVKVEDVPGQPGMQDITTVKVPKKRHVKVPREELRRLLADSGYQRSGEGHGQVQG